MCSLGQPTRKSYSLHKLANLLKKIFRTCTMEEKIPPSDIYLYTFISLHICIKLKFGIHRSTEIAFSKFRWAGLSLSGVSVCHLEISCLSKRSLKNPFLRYWSLFSIIQSREG